MKVLLTGTSGFIGRETLRQLLLTTIVTRVLVLSRRPLSDIEALDKRIEVFVLENFNEYPDELKRKLADVDAVIWALGGSATNPTPAGKCQEVEMEYPVTAVREVLRAKEATRGLNGKVRFLFVSGILSVKDQKKRLWFLEEGRRARGLAEIKLFEVAEKNKESFETVIIKVGLVLGRESHIMRVDEIAAGMVREVVGRRGTGSETVSNGEVRRRGSEWLRKGPK
ncbi:nucleoside-diphosphate-sugar epimerase protein [Rutstroemia sp. NJR-2017a WRK4]|nr:nucleoside-diphosphate-sugar epimerase protein [Rutstroemia sp. NJR-2017a WRK4]